MFRSRATLFSQGAAHGHHSQGATIITFVIIAAAWLFMVMHGTLGFERPHDAHAKFVDALHSLVWIAFLVSGWRLYTALRNRRA